MSRSLTTTEEGNMKTANTMSPVHPGEILREELDERDLSANALAQALGVPTNRITAILNGQRGITADTARRLSGYLGTSSEFWMNLQKIWELRIATIEAEGGLPVKFMSTAGSLLGGRHKDKKERISESLKDLQLSIDGLGTQSTRQYEGRELAQVLGALARLCSVFLRKVVLGDRGVSRTRLLDEAVMGSLEIRLPPLRRIPPERRRTIETGFGVGGGFLQATKVDEPGPGPPPTIRFPVAPHDLNIAIQWPLPGTADWIGTPSEKEPWRLGAKQLFDTDSTRAMSCDDWLGQQVVMFDGKGISLREIIRTVVNHEGAHALNVSRLLEVQESKPRRPPREAALHILNNITFFGIRYTHLIVIETALYLYERLLNETSIPRPSGDIYLVKPGFACPEEQARSSRPDWFRFDGTMVMVFSNEPKLTRHTIKPVG